MLSILSVKVIYSLVIIGESVDSINKIDSFRVEFRQLLAALSKESRYPDAIAAIGDNYRFPHNS